MDLGKLDDVYDEILGESGEKIETADPEPDAPAKGDPAYKEPAYDGLDGDDGVDPRDPSTKQDDDKPDDDDDDDGEPKGDADEEYEDIPDELVAAGRQAGYSDEEIIDLDAENRPVLEALAKALKAKGPEPKAKAEPEPKPKAEPDKKPDPKPDVIDELKFDLPGLDDELSQVAGPVQEIVNKLLSRVRQLESGLEKTQGSVAGVEKSREAEMFRQVDVFFDNQAEQLPELGDSKKFDQAAVDARMYAWNIANDLMTGSQGKIELQEALQIGVNALRGQVSETKLKARVVSDLNKRKQKFSPRPRGGRKGGQKPMTEEERGLAAIGEVLDDPKY